MLISWNWLNELVNLTADAQEFAENLTMAGTEVEEMSYTADKLKGTIIAKVLNIISHPEKKNLKVATLAWGKEIIATCITAAPNVKVGDVVPYAPPGATIADGTTLGIEEFGGIKSYGMMLSAEEMGMPLLSQEVGILILPQDAPLGDDAARWLGIKDIIFDVSITPNRGDLLSMVGMTQEAYALFPDSTIKKPEVPPIHTPPSWPIDFRGVTLKDPGCPLYGLGFADGLKIFSSPIKYRVRLALCGIRSISNIVDITNYTMLLFGQPLHAFDYDKLPAPEITVRSSVKGEKVVTLDEKEHELSSDDLLITSGGTPIGLAGVMGGANSEITDSTNRILIESAHFLPSRISTTARRLGINSEAAYRYARGVGKEKARLALSYALDLIEKWGCGKAYRSVILEGDPNPEERVVSLTAKKLNTYIGTGDLTKASEILSFLGFEIKSLSKERAIFKVPSFRLDVEIEEDLIEEVARMRGYDELPSYLPGKLHGSATVGPISGAERKLRGILMSRGYLEIVNYSFLTPKFVQDFMLPSSNDRANIVSLANPLNVEQSVLRTFLLPGMVYCICDNLRKGWRFPIRIFEIGNVFSKDEQKVREEKHVAGVIFLGKDNRSPYGEAVKDDFFTVKGDLIALLKAFGLQCDFLPGEEPFGHGGQTANVIFNGQKIGFITKIKPSLERQLELPSPLYAFEVAFDPFLKPEAPKFGEAYRYPPVFRDISITVPMDMSIIEVSELIRTLASDLVTSIRLFDIYSGSNIPKGYKSLSFTLEYRHLERTLSDDEVDELHNVLRAQIESKGLKLR